MNFFRVSGTNVYMYIVLCTCFEVFEHGSSAYFAHFFQYFDALWWSNAVFHNHFNGKNYLRERFSLYDKKHVHTMNFFRVYLGQIYYYVLGQYLQMEANSMQISANKRLA